jgi:hypothetical protein
LEHFRGIMLCEGEIPHGMQDKDGEGGSEGSQAEGQKSRKEVSRNAAAPGK